MTRGKAAIGLLLCFTAVSSVGNPNTDLSPLWGDAGLIGAVIFLVLLIKGPGKKRVNADHQQKADEEEEGRGAPE
ncbi:hypothetical protein [Streptomyces sp. MAR4 CNX-425]|uniref:hypothetical protein n=1 Tax=Streptomyces sp. MAR4 CNX-425 TaxID=3406343 RepID=UPI003B4FFA43